VNVASLSREEEIERVRASWEALAPGRNAEPARFLDVARTHPDVLRPHVFAMTTEDGSLSALLAARLERLDYRCRIARRTIVSASVRSLTVVYGGALRAGPDVAWNPLVRALADALSSDVADVAYLPRVEARSALLDALRAETSPMWRNESERPAAHWVLDLPDTFDALMRRVDGHRRKELGRYRRVLERTFPGRVETRTFVDEEDVPGVCVRAEAIARGAYQRGLGTGFFDDAVTRARLVGAARRGALRAHELVVDGVVRAFWIGEVHRGALLLDFTAYDAGFARYEPGTVLLLEVLKDAIAEGLRAADYGWDDVPYKRRFGARRVDERDVWLFRPGARSAWLNAARALVVNAGAAARRVVAAGGLTAAWNRSLRNWARGRVAAQGVCAQG